MTGCLAVLLLARLQPPFAGARSSPAPKVTHVSNDVLLKDLSYHRHRLEGLKKARCS
jgi:hypothetical protein